MSHNRVNNLAVQEHDCSDLEATAEHLRQAHREYQRRKSSVFARQVARAVEALGPPRSAEQRLQVWLLRQLPRRNLAVGQAGLCHRRCTGKGSGRHTVTALLAHLKYAHVWFTFLRSHNSRYERHWCAVRLQSLRPGCSRY